jgi:hypothetical protein
MTDKPKTLSELEPTRPCPNCKGTGKYRLLEDFPERACPYCDGRGFFEKPDTIQILKDIVCSRGKNKGRLRKSRPPYEKGERAYYVWRWARFHGGADVCIPMTTIRVDPYMEVLDVMADLVAKKAFGTDLAGATRWGQALGHLERGQVPEGLPASAYESGPPGTDIGGPEDSPEYHIDAHDRRLG